MMMSVDEIQDLTVTVDRALRMVANEVKCETEIARALPCGFEKREKEILLEKLEEKVNIGIEEASILMSLSEYISLLEAEKVKYSLQIQRLKEEKQWLLEEEINCGKRLHAVRKSSQELTNDRDMCRAAYVLRKNNPASCDRIISEFSKIMNASADCQDDALSPEFENFFSSKIQALYYLSVQCIKHNEFGLARLLVNRMLERILAEEGKTNPDVASLYEILAMIARREGKLQESLKYLQRSLQIREECFGKSSVQVSITLNNMSICETKCGLFNDALVSCSRALAIKELIYGSTSSDVAKQLHNLALICTYLGNFTEAHTYFQRALNIHINAKPFDEEKLLKTKNSVAMCLLRQNNLEEAQNIIFSLIDRYHERLLHQTPNPTDSPSIHMIIDMHAKESRKALNILYMVYGTSSISELSLVLKNLCTLYRKQKEDRKLEIIQEFLQKKYKARYKKLAANNKKLPSAHQSAKAAVCQGATESAALYEDHDTNVNKQSADEATCTSTTLPTAELDSSATKSRKTLNPFSYIFKKK